MCGEVCRRLRQVRLLDALDLDDGVWIFRLEQIRARRVFVIGAGDEKSRFIELPKDAPMKRWQAARERAHLPRH